MKRRLTIDEEIFLNQFTQNIHSLDKMNKWFDSYTLLDKRDIIENLFNIVIQSHPTIEDIESSAIALKKIKSSSATILLSKTKPFTKFGYRICRLPEKELLNGFDILLLTLSKADRRRKKNDCAFGCNHWWHQDLSNPAYLQELRRQANQSSDGSSQ